MSFDNYTNLQAEIVDWHKRDPGNIPSMIALAEKRINNLLESRLAEVESALTATAGSRYIALPTGFYKPLALWLTTYGNRIALEFVVPEHLPVFEDVEGQPQYFTIDGSNIAFNYLADQAHTFTFRYKKGYDIANTTTNHILTNHPAVYLYGALRECSAFARDPEAVQFEALFQQALQECTRTEFANKTQAKLAVDPGLTGTARTNILAGDL